MNDLQRALYVAVLAWSAYNARSTWSREYVVYIAGVLSARAQA